MEALAIVVSIVAHKLPSTCRALRQSLVTAIIANRIATAVNKLSRKLSPALIADEAILVPMLPKRRCYDIIHVSMAFGTHPAFNTFLVVGLVVLNYILAGNATVAFEARKKIACTILAQCVAMVVEE